MRTIAFFLLFFYLFFFIFGQKFRIVRNFLTIKSSSSPSPNPIPNKSDPEVRSPTPTWKLLVRKPNNCSQFGQDAAVTANPAQHRLLLPGRTGLKTEQLFGFLTREGRESCIPLADTGWKTEQL